MNNSSLLTADRTTHLKIVVVALLCATFVAAIGVASHMTAAAKGRLQATAPVVVMPAKPITAASSEQIVIR